MNRDNNLIFDVGMHKGEDTDYYLKKGFRVIAFEANPELIDLCKSKFSEQITNETLTIVDAAIVDESFNNKESIQFYRNKENSVWSTVVDSWTRRNERFGASNKILEVPTINFKRCLETYGIPYYLKIAIEGMDLVCLESLLKSDDKPAYISIESEKVSFSGLRREFELFEKLGYDKLSADKSS